MRKIPETSDQPTPRLELTTHCPKCRNVIGKETQVCTNCGVEVATVASVDRPGGPPPSRS